MSEKEEKKSKLKGDKHNNDDGHSKTQLTKSTGKDANKNQNEKEGEESLEEIEKELDELRPTPPSPKTKRRIEEEEKAKDREVAESKIHKESSAPTTPKSDHETNNQEHKPNELIPGQPDPTVNENVKIPILNDRGDIELKPQLGSAFHKNKNNNPSNNNQPTEEKKNEKA